ncbi:hypothetical protein [Altererythrobacter lauratis]|uniref:TonB C-terminal domain-containing protein n=1 Tax=Alteraurantiacibacter lauratis TaxID=2054627 RepID=A0ABV7EEL1_9SPHN
MAGAVLGGFAPAVEAQDIAASAPRISRPPPPPPAAPPSLLFTEDRFDVTGAGLLDLGNLDAVLSPFASNFGDGLDGLPLELTVDATGAVTACTAGCSSLLEAAGQALCAHALAHGRFVQNPLLALDYTAATYRLIVRYQSDRAQSGRRSFYVSTGFPYQGMAVRFGFFPLPPAEESLRVADVALAGMEYPLAALREGLEGRAAVLVTFRESGRVASCRPMFSSNTARLAYETCF